MTEQNSETQAPSLSDVGKQDSNPNGMPSLSDVQSAMEAQQINIPTNSEEEPSAAPTSGDGADRDSTPIGQNSTQLSEAELSALKESASAFEALQQHPEILSEAVQKIRAKYGEPVEDDGSPEGDATQQLSPAFQKRLDTLEQAITMLASRLVTSEMASKEPEWESLEPQVHKLMNEIPGLTLQQAVRFAKAEAGRVNQGGQQGEAPVLRTAEGHGAAPRVSEQSYTDEFTTAAKNIKKLKSSRDAADLAMREALRLAQIKQQS
jgi:hypothetical protein